MAGSTPHAPVARRIDTGQLESFDVLGAKIEFMTVPGLGEPDDFPCVMHGVLAPGIVVPLHSHADPETFILRSGSLEGLSLAGAEARWLRLAPGDVFHVPSHAKHAFRNFSDEPALITVVSTNRIGRFFREIGRPMPADARPLFPPAPETSAAFLRSVEKYGYWNASPAENAAVGLVLGPME
ncbi:MAG TPA: cupin domain-containing protein [Aliidongia sp.]|nr:cupin domain-containing protein [Aliidongia sp.]